MNSWYKFLEEIIEKEELENYTDLYYLGSCSSLEEESLLNAISENHIVSFLEKSLVSNTDDTLDFFLFKNDDTKRQELVIIYNPFELFESSHIYKVIDFFSDEISTLPNFQKIK